MSKVIPLLAVNIFVDCPHCEKQLDLFDEDDVGDFANSDDGPAECWNMIRDFVMNRKAKEIRHVNCQKCGGIFPLENMEY